MSRAATVTAPAPGRAPSPVPWLTVALAFAVLLSAGVGAVQIGPLTVVSILLHGAGLPPLVAFEPAQAGVLLGIRLPRTLLGVGVGAALATSGALMQGLFRNPLADPGLLGVSSGAALGAASVLVLGGTPDGAGLLMVPLAAFLGGLLATGIAVRVGSPGGRADTANLLLAGIAINALAGAGTGLLVFVADDAALRSLTFWTLGSLGGATWTGVWIVAVVAGLPAIAALRLGGALDALLLGEAEAGHLGVDVARLRLVIVTLSALMVGAAVALTGVVGFVGLVVPHLCRLLLGPGHRVLLPCSLLLGGVVVLLADAAARTIVSPAELPLGIVTTLIGGPFFLWLLASRGAT